MAGEYLRSHGIDIDAEMSRVQHENNTSTQEKPPRKRKADVSNSVGAIRNVSLPNTPLGSHWDVFISEEGNISDIWSRPNDSVCFGASIEGDGGLLAPSLCNPHVHIDKAYLLSHPKYAHLQIEKGDFSEAMTLTGKAKEHFEQWDLLERGQRLIDESVAAGVTQMRAFVEVDAMVGTKCLDAGEQLQSKAEDRGNCAIQLCAFAQLPLFTSSQGDNEGATIRKLMQEAASKSCVDVIGSTPYVEGDRESMQRNVEWMIDLSIHRDLHLDFHLDYNLDRNTEPMVWYVVNTLKEKKWRERTTNKTIVFGHCTRFTLFSPDEWNRLKKDIGDLPISFVGLPTSDLFMMRTPGRTRGTLDVPALIKDYGLSACIGINNIGNAFTPHGSCDPLTLACNGVGIYQAGTKQDAELMYECVSVRAREAIGMARTENENPAQGSRPSLELEVGDPANFVLFGNEKLDWRTRKSIAEAVYLYDHCRDRRAFLNGERTCNATHG